MKLAISFDLYKSSSSSAWSIQGCQGDEKGGESPTLCRGGGGDGGVQGTLFARESL